MTFPPSTSHLYKGFRHAGTLASIQAQRDLQRRALACLHGTRLLIVGSAFGEEANHLLYGTSRWLRVVAIDLVDVASQVFQQPVLLMLGWRFGFYRCDLLDTFKLHEYGSFDVVQCGFVLHDMPSREKDRAIRQLAYAVRPGGHIIISEIFSSTGGDQTSNAAAVYDTFLREATTARDLSRLRSSDFDELVGDGVKPGLLRSREEAVQGNRDFFEPLAETIERARCAGLRLKKVAVNPVNRDLCVLLFGRARLSRGPCGKVEELAYGV